MDKIKIKQEFSYICSRTVHPCRSEIEKVRRHPTASLDSNNHANRYADVLPVEETRIKIDNSESNYINANMVCYKNGPSCICCQAPLPSTFDYFWLMVWQQNVPVICALNRQIENGKVKGHTYWPSTLKEEITYGDISVTLMSSHDLKKFNMVVRRFHIRNNSQTGISREIFHIHFLGWPDFGVPDSTIDIRELVHIIKFYRQRTLYHGIDGPTILHCSAGIGRTGTFMGIFTAMENPSFQTIDYSSLHTFHIPDMVLTFRQQRNRGMVQTEKQYEFIYRSLLDEISSRCSREAIQMVINAELLEASEEVIFTKLSYNECSEIDSLRKSTKRCSLDTYTPRKKHRTLSNSFSSQNSEETTIIGVVDSWA